MTTETITGDAVREALRAVKDPELNLNIIDLGLVYDVEVEDGNGHIQMTLTSPGCPSGPLILNDLHKTIRPLDGAKDVDVDTVCEPYCSPEKIDPNVRAMPGF